MGEDKETFQEVTIKMVDREMVKMVGKKMVKMVGKMPGLVPPLLLSQPVVKTVGKMPGLVPLMDSSKTLRKPASMPMPEPVVGKMMPGGLEPVVGKMPGGALPCRRRKMESKRRTRSARTPQVFERCARGAT